MARKRVAGQPEGAGDRQPAGSPRATSEGRRGRDAAAAEAERRQAEADERAQDAQERVEHDLDELGETKRERDEYLELAKRTRADFDNYRKRVAKEAAEALDRGKAELARELIPAIDNLERALQAAGVEPEPQREDGPAGKEGPSEEVSATEALARGVALVHNELRANLERAGVEAYDPAGEPFDPTWHEALSTRPEEGIEPGIVLETLDRGYRLNGQLLRPARVVVSE